MPEEERPRLLGIDPGSRRTGVAISDELGMLAHPRQALVHEDVGALLNQVARIVDQEGITEVVVGIPLSLSGADSQQTTQVRSLVAALRRRLPVPITEWDERLSSVQAKRLVVEAGRGRGRTVDSAAAALILQAVLDGRRARS